MKRTVLSAALIAFALPLCAVEPGFTNVVARQRWPWSPVIDIDFTVTGTNTFAKFTAQCDGMEPFELVEKDLSGDFCYELKPGLHHVAWDPVRAGYDAAALKNFRVTVSTATVDRTFLILDLTDGSYTYAATEPEGGWFNDSTDYYMTKMVFRRVPAGTFTMGYSQEIRNAVAMTSSYGAAMAARKMTISTDYYMAVYKTTYGQHLYMTNRSTRLPSGTSGYGAAVSITYNTMRGSTNSPDCINWPHTGYDVAPGSVIALYRSLTESTFPSDWTIDLPTSAQWARAARATTPDDQIWHVGGTASDSLSTLTNYANQVGNWVPNGQSKKLGQHTPNGWGFYDFNGSAFEWGLDWYGWFGSTTDPVGPATNTSGRRARCGAYHATSYLSWMVPGYIYYYQPSSATPGYRLCIHLKQIRK